MIAVYSTEWYELRDAAASMYDGGWRAEDREQIRIECDAAHKDNDLPPVTDEELDIMCKIMRELAEEDAED